MTQPRLSIEDARREHWYLCQERDMLDISNSSGRDKSEIRTADNARRFNLDEQIAELESNYPTIHRRPKRC